MNITEALNELGVPFKRAGEHHHVTRRYVGVDCPWCSPAAGSYKLGFSLATSWCRCWTCGPRNPVEALALITGLPFGRVKAVLGKLDRTAPPPRPTGRLELPDGLEPLRRAHLDYLRGRGFDPDELRRHWGVELGTGPTAKLAWRVFIPIHSGGKVVSWTTRAVGNGRSYVGAKPEQEAVPSKSLLYGADQAENAIIICEGPADAWRIGPGAVATLGLGFTRAQVRRAARFPRRAVCYDNEPAAQARASALCEALGAFPGVTVRVEIDANDPGSASEMEVGLLRRSFLD